MKRPPIEESDRRSLADEISDALDSHGTGLSAETLAETLDEVAAAVAGRPAVRRSRTRLRDELEKILEAHADRFPDRILEVLDLLARDIARGSLVPTVEHREVDGDTLVLSFRSAFSLERELQRLFDIRGFYVETEISPRKFDEVGIVVEAAPIRRSVSLDGRILRSAPGGIAVRLYEPDPATREELRELPRRVLDALRSEHADDEG